MCRRAVVFTGRNLYRILVVGRRRMAACSLLADVVGVTECISSTPKIVSAISNPVAEATPGRLRRITECMSPTIASHTP
ncbi:hypothetical protein [Rhodococcus sp. BS-15]|uniref:hypothetical protein n=1 Tax=Rhodococcus sp. BS-15 TaxID=1304954 RepID=UPI001F368BA9|nr:hypothetical protein [Rhodococcus sp. BS-15]